jgi:hypothetical protein
MRKGSATRCFDGEPGPTLPDLQQEISVSAYPAVVPASTPILLRRIGSNVTIVTQPGTDALATSRAVRVDVRAQWTGSARTACGKPRWSWRWEEGSDEAPARHRRL